MSVKARVERLEQRARPKEPSRIVLLIERDGRLWHDGKPVKEEDFGEDVLLMVFRRKLPRIPVHD